MPKQFPSRRFRYKFPTYTWNGSTSDLTPYVSEEIVELSPRPTTVEHWTTGVYSGQWADVSSGSYQVTDVFLNRGDQLPTWCSSDLDKFVGSLNRLKLSSTNEFGLVQFFAELDDTIALFTKKFWKELSYGSVSWGVLPFVSEMKKILKFLKRSSKKMTARGERYEDLQSVTVTKTDSNAYGAVYTATIAIEYRVSGYVSFPGISESLKWLDRLGFHPDINVAWDLLPLSFMVDWFLPVGDYIKSMKTSGWVNTVFFTGWETVKITSTAKMLGHTDPTSSRVGDAVTTSTYYRRRYVEQTLSLKSTPTPTLSDVPGKFANSENQIKNIFDTAYLLFQGKRN